MKKFVKGLTLPFISLIAVLCWFLTVSSASASLAYLDFNIDATHPTGPGGAKISFAGGANPLVGSNISVDSVAGYDEIGNLIGVVHNITGGRLDFQTGLFSGSSATKWIFNGDDSLSYFTVTGGISDLGIAADTTLLSGHLTSASAIIINTKSKTFNIALGAFTDTKNADLIAAYLIASNTPFEGGFNLSYKAAGSPPGGFTSSSVLSGDIINSPVVPIPPALWLLGSGLVGLLGIRRRIGQGKVSANTKGRNRKNKDMSDSRFLFLST